MATMKTTSIAAMSISAARFHTPMISARPHSSSIHGMVSAMMLITDAGTMR